MIVPSIDLLGGQTVQLVGGEEPAIEAGDPTVLARRFGRVGPIAVIDLDADLRLRIEPSRFLSDSTTLTRLLGYVTSETTLRLQEKSGIEDERAIYLLELSRFLDDSTTLLGSSLIGQDITLFDRDPDFTMRLRFQQRQGLTRLFSGPERSASRLRSVTIEWGPTDDVGLAFEGQLEDRSLLGDGIDATRAHDLAILRLESDFSYRPTPALELGWIFRRRAADDAFPAIDRSTVLIGNELRASYAIETKGRLRASIERTVVDGENLAGGDVFSLPFQLTDGYGIGTSWIGILAFDYRFGAHIQATISYTGRSEPPSGRVIHIGSSGVRAFF